MSGEVMTRAEHLQWAKDRAMAYVRTDDHSQAFASFVSDLSKHPELENHPARVSLGPMLLLAGRLNSEREIREFIQGTR